MKKLLLIVSLCLAVPELAQSQGLVSAGTTRSGALFSVPAFTNPTAESSIPSAIASPIRAVLSISPGSQATASLAYMLRARGTITTGGNITNTLNIRFNSGANTNLTTFTGDTTLATSGAVTINTTTADFYLRVALTWSVASGALNCYYEGTVGATLIAPTACSNIPVSVATQSGLAFVLTDVFGTSNAGNSISLNEFSADPN